MEGYLLDPFETDMTTVGSVTDITDRLRAEEDLRSANKQLSQIIEFLPDATFVIDKGRRVIAWNKAIEEMTGVSKKSMIGKDNYAYAVPFYKETRPVAIDLVLLDVSNADLKYKYLEKVDSTIYAESYAPYVSQGRGAWLWIKASPLVDNEGNINGAIESIRDITERKQAEEELHLSEARFSKAFNSSPYAMAITRFSDHRIIDVNQRWLDTTGYSREEVVGEHWDKLSISTKDQRWQIFDLMNKCDPALNREIVLRNKKGEERYGLWSGEVITFDGDPCLLSAIRDITELKQMEREMTRLDRLNLIGEIAAGIAHEIRNPITVVRGNLQVLQLKDEFADHQKRFNTMIEEIDRANSIITEFLALARNKPVDIQKQSINSIINNLLPLIQADAAKNEMAVSTDLADIPDLNLDGQQIRQLVLNLVRNGIEAMPRHGELVIKTRQKKDRAILSIKDRGNGIPSEVLEKLGTPFFSTKDNGTGLGLPVCYRISESHNARIDIKTGKKGTTVMVSFPILYDEV
jgi:PAS domain S-box-containing protein